MSLINADVFLGTVASYRLVWISGRFGGGKTSLAYEVSKTFLDRDYRLITNNASIWADDINEIELDKDNHLKAVVLLDEGGLWFKAGRQIEMIASYAAKMDVIYLLPSFWPPTRSAQVLVVQPIFNFKSAGLPIIVYKWRVKVGSFEDKGFFLWYRPQEIYGVYSRQDPGDRGADIVEFLIEKTGEYRSRYGREADGLQTMEIDEADYLQEAAAGLSDAVDGLVSIQKRKRSR